MIVSEPSASTGFGSLVSSSATISARLTTSASSSTMTMSDTRTRPPAPRRPERRADDKSDNQTDDNQRPADEGAEIHADGLPAEQRLQLPARGIAIRASSVAWFESEMLKTMYIPSAISAPTRTAIVIRLLARRVGVRRHAW